MIATCERYEHIGEKSITFCYSLPPADARAPERGEFSVRWGCRRVVTSREGGGGSASVTSLVITAAALNIFFTPYRFFFYSLRAFFISIKLSVFSLIFTEASFIISQRSFIDSIFLVRICDCCSKIRKLISSVNQYSYFSKRLFLTFLAILIIIL